MGPSVVEALEKEARYFMSSGLAMTVDICIPLLLGGWRGADLHRWRMGRKRDKDSVPQWEWPGRSVSALNRGWVTLEVSFLANSSTRSHFLPAIQITVIICTSSKPERQKINGPHETPLPSP